MCEPYIPPHEDHVTPPVMQAASDYAASLCLGFKPDASAPHPETPVEHLPEAGLSEIPNPSAYPVWVEFAQYACLVVTALVVGGFFWTCGQYLALAAVSAIGLGVDVN